MSDSLSKPSQSPKPNLTLVRRSRLGKYRLQRRIGKGGYCEVEMQNDRGKKIISDVRELPYEYRGRRVMLRTLEVGLIEIVAKLIPQYVLKI